MLYKLYETQRSMMEPFVDFAKATSKVLGNAKSPFNNNPMVQRLSAGYDLMYRLGKDYVKPAFGIQTVEVNGTAVTINERIEVNKPFCDLIRFKRYTDDVETLSHLKGQPAVLIVAPLSGHYSTLLRDTVKTMLQDHKVYITDWKNARTVPLSEGEFHLDDYVNYVQEFIRHVQSKYGNCHVMSVCQPTVPVLAAVSLMATRGETTPLSLTMMGGPIDARKSPTAVNNLAMNKPFSWFENNVIYKVPANFEGAGRRVYPGFLQHTGFVAMNPQNHRNSHFDYFNDLIKGDDSSVESHRKFYDEYNAVLDMDADYYLETISTVFQDFKLVNGTWDVKNVDGKPERVKPADIKTSALLTVEGELDDISGSGQTEAAHGLCSGIAKTSRQHFEAKGAGHYGIFSGRRWREQVYPEVKAFIAAHQTAVKASTKALLAAPVKAEAPAVVTPAAVTAIAAPAAKEVAAVKAPVAQVAVAPAPVAQVPVVKTPVAQASVKAVTKVVPPKAAAKPAKAVTKPAPKVVSKPLIAEKSQSKVKTSWVAAPKK
jgi:poly(3-hydroxybutyrate) depolymerase